jgi:hypothetical protein
MHHGRLLILSSIFTVHIAFSQRVIESFHGIPYNVDSLRSLTGTDKVYPAEYELQSLLALSHFPELKDARVEIRFSGTKSLLLSTITFRSMFQHASRRSYQILLRRKSSIKLSPALFSNLSFDGQVAALAHELAHTVEFRQKSFTGMINIALRHLSKKAIDKQERDADMLVIKRGLGFPMYDWRKSTAKAFAHKQKEKPEEEHQRYMGPKTVLQSMLKVPRYLPYQEKINTLLVQHENKN